MPSVAPDASFEAVAQFTTGLAGTLGVRIIDNQGGTSAARVTAGISEFPAGSGVYEVTLTAPSVAGQYTILWDDAAVPSPNFAVDELVVTFSAPTSVSGTLYITREELKSSLSIQGETYADDDIDISCEAASRAIDEACGRWFYESAEVRVYYADPCYDDLEVDDIVTVNSVSVDTGGDGSFSTTWVPDVDFNLRPFNNPLKGKPYDNLKIRPISGRRFPVAEPNVKIDATFGWSSVPSEVRQYAKILATKLLIRSRQAPFGVLSYGMDQPIAVRIARHDPDFERLLGHLAKRRLFI